MQELASLAAAVADVAAVRAVKRLQHAWAHYAEAGDLAAMADLFARDGRLVLPPREARGREEILATLVSVMGHGQPSYPTDRLNVPLLFSPVVTIAPDGRSARGRWHEVALTGRFGRRSSWAGGIHENEYVLEDGVWRLALLNYHPQFAANHADGWRTVSDAVPLVPFHFTPDGAGTPVARTPAARGGEPTTPDVVARARAAVDESSVISLVGAYGHYLDRKLWEDVLDLFADDGVLQIGEQSWHGRAGIRSALEIDGPLGLRPGELFDHVQLMPIVTLAADGSHADVRAVELQMLARHGEFGHWGIRIAEFRIARVGTGWRIERLRISPRLLADHAIGWDRDLPELPPNTTAFPEHSGPPIAFPHPVRDPALPPDPIDDDLAEATRLLAIARAFDGAENVASAYGYFLDEAHWDETAELFARDGWKELSFVGTYLGRERIRDSLVARYGRKTRNPAFLPLHQKTEPVVTVSADGMRAQIRLKMFQVNSGWEIPPSMVTGMYEEQVVLEDGVWRIHGMDLEYLVVADFAGGWASVTPGLARKFAPSDEAIAAFEPAPDAPLRGLPFAPFPEVAPLGFHYANPVSGRPPQLRFAWSDGRFTPAE